MLPRLCECEVKQLRSSACCRQENAIFSPHIHRTWEAYFSPSLFSGDDDDEEEDDMDEMEEVGTGSSNFFPLAHLARS